MLMGAKGKSFTEDMIKQVDGGKGPTGLPNHWCVAPIYKDPDTGAFYVAKEEARSVPPGLGQKYVKQGTHQKIGELEQTDPRSYYTPKGPPIPRYKEYQERAKQAVASKSPKAS